MTLDDVQILRKGWAQRGDFCVTQEGFDSALVVLGASFTQYRSLWFGLLSPPQDRILGEPFWEERTTYTHFIPTKQENQYLVKD